MSFDSGLRAPRSDLRRGISGIDLEFTPPPFFRLRHHYFVLLFRLRSPVRLFPAVVWATTLVSNRLIIPNGCYRNLLIIKVRASHLLVTLTKCDSSAHPYILVVVYLF